MGVQHNNIVAPRHGDMTGEVLVRAVCPGARATGGGGGASSPGGLPVGKPPQPDGSADSETVADGLLCFAFSALSSNAATAEAAQSHAAATAQQRDLAAADAEDLAAHTTLYRLPSAHQQRPPVPPKDTERHPHFAGSSDSLPGGLPTCSFTSASLPSAQGVAAASGIDVPACAYSCETVGARTGCESEEGETREDSGRRDHPQPGYALLPDQGLLCGQPPPETAKVWRTRSGSAGYTRIDAAAARRLARRLYNLEGFKRSDVVKHLSKSNDFARLVADEYLLHFDLSGLTLVEAMRAFFGLHPLPFSTAESPEQQCVASHVARRYVSCNPGFLPDAGSRSEDACRTLACAILLLNANLHGQNAGKKISLSEFIKDVQSLHSGYVYSEPLLRSIYSDMQLEALSNAGASEEDEQYGCTKLDHVASHAPLDGAMELTTDYRDGIRHSARTERMLMQMSKLSTSFEYKRGYVRRKLCKGASGCKVPLGKRSWKTVFAVLRGTMLRLAESEPAYDHDDVKANISVDNALASVAFDYTKSGCVLRLETADGSEYLLQTGDSVDLEDWVEVINLVAASMSCAAEAAAPPPADSKRLANRGGADGGGSDTPGRHSHSAMLSLLGSGAHSDVGIGLDLKSRMKEHDWRIAEIECELADRSRRQQPSPASSGRQQKMARSSTAAAAAQAEERWLLFELKRRRVHSELLKKKLAEFPELGTSFEITAIGECDEPPLSPRSIIGPTGVIPWGSL